MKPMACSTVVIFLATISGAQQVTNIDPHAEQLLRAACQYLAEAPFFAINAEIWREHVNREGEKLQFTRSMEMEVKRPNRLHAEISSPHSQRAFWYDGKSLAVLDRKHNVFSTADMPGPLDQALDTAHSQFGEEFTLSPKFREG